MIGDPVRIASHDQRRRFLARSAVFATGVLAGSTLIGSLLGLLGSQIPQRHLVFLAMALPLLAYTLLREVARLPLPIFQRRWHVPREWMTHFWFGAFAFGVIMGCGFFTYMPSMLYYIYLAACATSDSAVAGGAIGVLYGAVFASAVLASSYLWRSAEAGGQTDLALSVLERARLFGGLASPLLLTMPAILGLGV